MAIDALIEAHRRLADATDIDLSAETRFVALWEMSGRCLGLASALLDQLRRGWTAETVGTMRVLHEAANLLVTFVEDEDETLTRRWLRGGRIAPREARERVGEFQERAAELARAVGVEIEGDIEELGREIYRILTRGAHNDREGFAECVSGDTRAFAYGPHPDVRVRAVYVDYGGELIEQITMDVGSTLARFFGREFYDQTVKPLIRAMHVIRDDMPIDANVRRAWGY